MNWADWFVPILVISLGAAIGSFLNVVIYRLPAGLSLLTPPSRCPHCQTPLKPYDNIPILGWLWLKGRCRYCQGAISPRYPLVEAATAGLFLLIYSLFGLSIQTLGYWGFGSLLLTLALIDLDTMLLPNPLTQSGVMAGLAFQSAVGLGTQWDWSGLASGLMAGFFGAILGMWIFDFIRIAGTLVFGQVAMGGGDAKLAAMIGAWLGWKLLLVSAFLACLFGSIIGIGGMTLGLIGRRQPIPFGPYLVLGAALSALWGKEIIEIYLRWIGL